MPRKDTRHFTGIALPGQPDLDSLVTALEGLEAYRPSKKTSSQDKGSSSGSGYLSTPLLDSSAATCTPSTSAATPPVTDVEDPDRDPQWYHLTQTKDHGLALTAARRIPAGTLVLSEPALIKIPLSAENDSSAIDTEVNDLPKSERKQFLLLFNAKKGSGHVSQAWGIYNSNCYNIEAFDDEGGSCIGVMSSRINHSCLPNLTFSYIPAAQVTMAMTAGLSPVDEPNALRCGMMQFRTIKNISKGKELLSNYEKSIFVGRKARTERLRRYYGFDCECEACAPPSEFWVRSDARRKVMEDCVRAGAEANKSLAENAIAKLQKLEGLLLKEGLTYTPLANCYKSLAKWTTRIGQDAIPWLEKEQEVVMRCFGRDSLRAQTLAALLLQKADVVTDVILIAGPSVADPPAKHGRSTSPTLFQHLPAQILQARCLIYEHDLSPRHLETPIIQGEAEKLFEALKILREATSSVRHTFILKEQAISIHNDHPTLITVTPQADRLLLFIGHSLGAILIKDPLIKGCDTAKAHLIVQCIAGDVFLGASHPENAQTALFNESRALNGPLEVVGPTNCILKPFVSIPLPADQEYPFLEYAASSWVAHAKAANSGSISDEEFLRYLPWPTDPEMRLVSLVSSIVRLSFGGSQETCSTFLHCAAYCGLDKPIRAFLRPHRREEAKGSDIDKPTSFGRTPLHIAASMGHWSVVNYLLARGANVKAKDAVYGNSILHWVAKGKAT
ncbi:hypothetical protein DV736_g2504, partial [Chaetothyriales sp. CBS 134916]